MFHWSIMKNKSPQFSKWSATGRTGPDRLADVMTDRLLSAGRALNSHAMVIGNQQISALPREAWLEEIFEVTPDYLWAKDRQSRYVVANAAMLADTPFATAEEIAGKTDFDIHDKAMAEQFFAREQQIMASGKSEIGRTERIIDAHGKVKWVLTSKVPVWSETGEVIGVICCGHDITARKLAEDLLKGQSALMEMITLSKPVETILEELLRLIEGLLDGVMSSLLLLDETGTHLRKCAAPTLPVAWSDLIDGVKIGPSVGSCGTAAWTGKPVIVEDIFTNPLWADYCELARPFGLRSCWSTPIFSHDGRVLGTFGLYSLQAGAPDDYAKSLIQFATDIAGIALDRKYAEDRIRFMALHDTLTGLPNRATLQKNLQETIDAARIAGEGVMVAYIDVDNFKMVNDSLGHAAGDEALRSVAARLGQSLPCLEAAYRMGGDEFLVVMRDRDPTCTNAWESLLAIHRKLADPILAAGTDFSITCSVGASGFPATAGDMEALLAQADAAMYRAKAFGRDNCQRYNADMETNVRERLALHEELRIGIENDQLRLVYQPQIELASGRIVGLEALVRWQHPRRGLIPPAIFIPVAEESGLISQLGSWVLAEACRQNRLWQDAGLPQVPVSVNVAARQFREQGFIDVVRDALAANRLSPASLEVEVTESLIMQDLPHAVATMEELDALGVRIAIDDFGTGYSSLSALKRFPVSRLKIDQSFVAGLPGDESDAAICSAVISMAQKLNLKVIAEGVETIAQSAFLRSAGCDQIQGYLISRPVSPDDIADLHRQRRF
ncbi:putative bifunctional diguanylate cyclase/phosphodiesterase [Rhizobium sp. PAMB 3174]